MSEEALVMPWVIFTVRGNNFAVHSRYVTGITVPPDKIEATVGAPDIYKGVVEMHGERYPYLDMRMLFRYKSMKEECDDFVAMLEKHKQEHIAWANALKKSVMDNVEFQLATDPHRCSFGKWFYDYCGKEENAKSVLQKIEQPHRTAHEAADKIMQLMKMPDSVEKKTHIKELLNSVMEEYLPEIISIIDDTIKQVKFASRETMILIDDGAKRLAVAVDRVVAVDEITKANGKDNMLKIINSMYFSDMGVSPKINGGILIADDEKLLERAKDDNIMQYLESEENVPANA